MESLGWSCCAFTGVVWLCIHWGGVVVYSLGCSDCVFTRVEWLCVHLEWNGCVFTGVE